MEKYPSLVEGTGLENREVGDGAGVRIPLSPPFIYIAEWSSLVARRAHNPKVVGSNPAPATTKRSEEIQDAFLFCRAASGARNGTPEGGHNFLGKKL